MNCVMIPKIMIKENDPELYSYLRLLLNAGVIMISSILLFFGIGFIIYSYLFANFAVLLTFTFLGVSLGFYFLYQKIIRMGEKKESSDEIKTNN